MDFLWQDISHAPFWIAVAQIIGVNIILSGDNAVVIAMACMTLPPRQRLWGMILGAGVAVLLRVIFTVVVAEAMTYPFLQIVGGALLFWVAVKLVTEDADGDGDDKVKGADNLLRAVITITVADIVMSLDNVIAIAAAAKTAAEQVDVAHASSIKATLIIFGLATSVPLIVAGSAILMALLERFRVLVWGGGALLGWVAGDVMTADTMINAWFGLDLAHSLHHWGGRLGAIFVVTLGLALVRSHRRLIAEELWTFVAVLVWVAADVVIAGNFTEEQVEKIWASRILVFLILASDYVVLRARPAAETAVIVESNTVVVETEREKEKA